MPPQTPQWRVWDKSAFCLQRPISYNLLLYKDFLRTRTEWHGNCLEEWRAFARGKSGYREEAIDRVRPVSSPFPAQELQQGGIVEPARENLILQLTEDYQECVEIQESSSPTRERDLDRFRGRMLVKLFFLESILSSDESGVAFLPSDPGQEEDDAYQL